MKTSLLKSQFFGTKEELVDFIIQGLSDELVHLVRVFYEDEFKSFILLYL